MEHNQAQGFADFDLDQEDLGGNLTWFESEDLQYVDVYQARRTRTFQTSGMEECRLNHGEICVCIPQFKLFLEKRIEPTGLCSRISLPCPCVA